MDSIIDDKRRNLAKLLVEGILNNSPYTTNDILNAYAYLDGHGWVENMDVPKDVSTIVEFIKISNKYKHVKDHTWSTRCPTK